MSTKTTKVNRIGIKKAIEIIEGSKGKFMQLTCDTQKTKNRTFNCIYKETTKTGHVNVIERGKGNKAVNLQTLSALKANGNVYKIV